MASIEDGAIPTIEEATAESMQSEHNITSRAYQLEMYDLSLKQNIIVCMETGSGKTQIARLRIEAELGRNPAKLVWLLAPSQVLAVQQHVFLTSQLPMYIFRLITGADHAEYWSSKDVWDAALLNQNGIVSTPDVLLDALKHYYVSLSDISILIFDEAHHCIGNHAYSKIMKLFYHPVRENSAVELPHVLGLTASPMIRDDLKLITELEKSMDAICRSPTTNLEQYRAFTNVSDLVWLPFATTPDSKSLFVPLLEILVRSYDIEADPTIARLRKRASAKENEKLEKYLDKGETPILSEIKDLLKKSVYMEEVLGYWATDRYVLACIDKLSLAVRRKQDCLFTVGQDEQTALATLLSPLRDEYLTHAQPPLDRSTVSPKVASLVRYLEHEYRSGMACVVFVQRRSVAYALCDVLRYSRTLKDYRSFTFVGSSNPMQGHLTDLADYGQQGRAFADFRAGKQNICIATEVLEEGIDVQACNLVVCFDLPQTNRSFIQRRGRARHQSAKFVLMCPSGLPTAKHHKWEELEEDMKRLYLEQDRVKQELVAREADLDDADEDQPLRHGKAMVEKSDGRRMLEYFCNTMKRYGEPTPSPVYILDRSTHGAVGCRVILPSDLPSDIRSVQSSQLRSTEAAAKRDAAFQAYKRLHQAGLLNDHLMPIHAKARKRRGARFSALETRGSKVEVSPSADPWEGTRVALMCTSGFHASQVLVPGLPTMLLLLPSALPESIRCNIHTISDGIITARIARKPELYHVPLAQAAAVTKFLFRYVLGRRLPGIDLPEYMLPYYLVPDIDPGKLLEWLETSQRSSTLHDFKFDPCVKEYMINKYQDQMPYFYQSPGRSPLMTAIDGEIEVVRLSRIIDFTAKASGPRALPVHRSLAQEDCIVSFLEASYVRVMAYIPTILHAVETAIRVHQAQTDPLQSVRFADTDMLSAALTAPGAGLPSYQRLEYLGDVVLKFMATINAFCNNPNLSEGGLSVAMDRIVNNARLHRSTLELGLDAFLTVEPFSSSAWTLAPPPAKANRQLSTKTLADVIEALLGVAYIETASSDFGKVVKALQLFLPEITWDLPEANIAMVKIVNMPSDISNERLDHVQHLIGYRFKHTALLAEALNHSSTSNTMLRSYDRLEFLGDAILDLLVKKPLYDSPRCFNENDMTLARHALVDKETFAFLTTAAQYEVVEKAVNVTNLRKKTVQVEDKRKIRHLHDYMTRVPSLELAQQRTDLLRRYGEVQTRVSDALENGNTWPWADLLRLASPKWASDVLESLVGAVFVDSGADLGKCEEVVRKLGLMKIVERIARDGDVEFRQARVKARERWIGVKYECARYHRESDSDGEGELVIHDVDGTVDEEDEEEGSRDGRGQWLWRCRVEWKGVVIGEADGATCVAEAEERAAEVALAATMAGSGEGGLSGELERQGSARKREREDDESEEDGESVGFEVSRNADIGDIKEEGLNEDVVMGME